MRAFAAARWGLLGLSALLAAACTTSHVRYEHGCWVRRSSKFLGDIEEEVGLCARPMPQWSDDRHTRLVQECVVQADYQWSVRAMAAWRGGKELPAQESLAAVTHRCYDIALAAAALENDALRVRLGESQALRKEVEARAEREAENARDFEGDLAEYLGEAAKREVAPAVATATATSDGKATSNGRAASDGDATARSQSEEESGRDSRPARAIAPSGVEPSDCVPPVPPQAKARSGEVSGPERGEACVQGATPRPPTAVPARGSAAGSVVSPQEGVQAEPVDAVEELGAVGGEGAPVDAQR